MERHTNGKNTMQYDHDLETKRKRLPDHSTLPDHNTTMEVPITAPLKPIRYIRRFDVPVLIKSRLSRFLKLLVILKINNYFIMFNCSRRNPNFKQWLFGKRQFNDDPKEVNIFHYKIKSFNFEKPKQNKIF